MSTGQESRTSEPIVSALGRWFEERREPGIVSVYLFGSRAEGRAHRESDVDVAVLLDRSVYPSADARWDLRVRLTSEVIYALHHNEVDLIVLNDVPPTLGRKVVRDGLRVFCADAEADHAFARDVRLRAADLDIWLRRVRRVTLEAISR